MINSFLLIGQSNMAGRGNIDEVDPIHNENVFMFREGIWINAREPIHNDKPELCGIGLAASFSNRLQVKYGKNIGVIPCAFGGTSLEQWKKGSELYINAVNTARKALKESKLKGILWHQGESDAQSLDTALTYKKRFLEMMCSIIKDLGYTSVVVITGELGYYLRETPDCKYWKEVNNALKEISDENNNYSFVYSEGLKDKGDLLHFDSESLREFGLRYASAWEKQSSMIGIALE
jgi:Domain of unknown function (DUF303).